MAQNYTDLFPETRFLVAVDPGKRYCGVALFDGPRLVDAARPNPGDGHQIRDVEHVAQTAGAVLEWAGIHNAPADPMVCVAEMMHARGRRDGKTPDLLPLCAIAGWCVGALGGRLVDVLEWKSTYPKKTFHPWILAELDDAETAVLERVCSGLAAAHRLDVVDAVGIGLWARGRDARRHAVG